MDYFVKRLHPFAPAEKTDDSKDPATNGEGEHASAADVEEACRAPKRPSVKKPLSKRQHTIDEEQNRLAHILGWRKTAKRAPDRHTPKM